MGGVWEIGREKEKEMYRIWSGFGIFHITLPKSPPPLPNSWFTATSCVSQAALTESEVEHSRKSA